MNKSLMAQASGNFKLFLNILPICNINYLRQRSMMLMPTKICSMKPIQKASFGF